MVQLLIAIIGLVGSFAAGSAFSDWLKRRSLHGSIKADLEIWASLPDGTVKTNLLSRIEQRTASLTVDRPSPWRIQLALWLPPGFIWSALLVGVSAINGGYSFRRDTDGILRWHTPNGGAITFEKFLLSIVALYIVALLFAQLGLPLVGKAVRWAFSKMSRS